ncbi:SA1362 family protein [Domibacillus sp. 8LH]|uniref:SA1362 family protein n=1 Tax=unclassified Domibacillus TaxID=2632383 RepID=UPI0028F10BD6|nr:SA1362 family protein [Domibacillus sp. DTU_2020_1001157_1_SI_ALB_TIR_016]WNS81978.1 SA1362 family protein [Domibacillus sp. DTU_2020_1001157_1_SI_ALB_TIR_016]
MNVRTVVVSVITALAAIGLVSMMITSPGQLVQQIAFAVITVAIVMFLLRLFMRNRTGGNHSENRAYSKAVKQSKKRYATKTGFKSKPSVAFTTGKPKKKAARRKKASHLTLIQGNKGKRSSRASSE